MFTSTPLTALPTPPKDQPLGRNARRRLFHSRRNLRKQPWPCKMRLAFDTPPDSSRFSNTSSMSVDVGSGDSPSVVEIINTFEVSSCTIDLVTPPNTTPAEEQAAPQPGPSPIQEYPREVWDIINNPANVPGQVWNVVVTTTYVVTPMG